MVRSVDMQQVLLQTNSVERVQQVQQQHPDVQQRYFENQLNKEKKELKKKVQHAHETDHLSVNTDEERKKQEHQCQDDHRNDAQGQENDKGTSSGEPGAKIDIRV